MYTVYKATHKPTGLFYIGRTKRPLGQRMGQHWTMPANRRKKFQNFLITTDINDWVWETIQVLENYKESLDCEMYYINLLDACSLGLNTKTGARADLALKQASERLTEYRAKNPEPWNKGRTQCYSEETLQKMSLAKLRNPSIVVYTEELKQRKALEATNSKRVKELTTGLEFISVSAAAKHFNIRRESVRDVVSGRRRQTAGLVFISI